MTPAVATLIDKYKGYADIVLGITLATSLTRLPVSSAHVTPAFNRALACMFFALGAAHIAAARLGRGAHATFSEFPRHPPLHAQIKVISLYSSHYSHAPHSCETAVAASATWAVLALLTCLLTPRAWRVGSAAFFVSGCVHAVVCVFMWVLEPGILRLSAAGNSRKWF